MTKKPTAGVKVSADTASGVTLVPTSPTSAEIVQPSASFQPPPDDHERLTSPQVRTYIARSITYRSHIPGVLCKILDDLWKYIPFQYADIRRIDANMESLTILVHKISGQKDAAKMEPARPGCSYLGDRKPTIEEGITGHVALTDDLYYARKVGDSKDDPYYHVYRQETRSAVAVPLKLGSEMLGVLLLEADQPEFFTEEQLTCLRDIAVLIAATLQRERQDLSEDAWLQRYAALEELNQRIANSGNLDLLLQEIAKNIQDSIEGCDLCRFIINDTEKQRLHIMASQAEDSKTHSAESRVLLYHSDSVAGEVVRSKSAKFVASLAGEEKFHLKEWAKQHDYYAALFLPLQDPEKRDEVLGCIVLYTKSPDAIVLKKNRNRAEKIALIVANAFARLRQTLPNSVFQTIIEKCSEGGTEDPNNLRTILDIAMDKTGGQFGSIFRSVPAGLILAATTGITDIEDYRRVIYNKDEEASKKHRTSWVAFHGRSLRILNQNDLKENTGGEQFEHSIYTEKGDVPPLERGFLAAPILAIDPATREPKIFGVIRIVHKKEGLPFTPVDQLILVAAGKALGLGMMSAERIAHDQNMLNRIGEHNLLQPITLARQNCGYLLEVDLPPDKVREKLLEMQVALKQAQDGIAILASLTNIQNKGYDTIDSTQEVDLTERLRRIIGMLGEQARHKSLDFTQDFAPDQKSIVLGDDAWLTRAFYELLHNAVKYSAFNSRINISLRRQDGFWRIVVHNTGKVPSLEDLSLLWTPGTRVNKVNGRRKEHGYGLSDMRNIIEHHKGKVELDPPAPTSADNTLADWRFFIDLPASSQLAADTENQE